LVRHVQRLAREFVRIPMVAVSGIMIKNAANRRLQVNLSFLCPRLWICGAVLMLAPRAEAQTVQPSSDSTASSTIVFVCEHGAAKSVIAAAHFNRLASEKGLPYRAVSRGTKPDEAVAPVVRTGLAKEGIDVSAWSPTAVTDEDIRRAARVVSIATDLPSTKPLVKSKLLEWNDVPSLDQNYEAARKALLERVAKLVESLAPNRN
jgi:protein-tyrosine-phosphatase